MTTAMNSFSTTTSTAATDNKEEEHNTEEIEKALWKVSLSTSNKKDMQQALQELHRVSTPKVSMELLASHLFIVTNHHQHVNEEQAVAPMQQEDEEDTRTITMDSKRALHVLTSLVTCRPNTYLLEASRAVRRRSEMLVGHNNTAAAMQQHDTSMAVVVQVSQEELQVVASQLASSSSSTTTTTEEQVQVEVSNNASHALVALCQAYPPAYPSAIQIVTNLWNNALTPKQGLDRTKASTIAVRCASTIVNLVCHGGDEAMQVATATTTTTTNNNHNGAMQALIHMLSDTSDPLMQMSALDLVEQCALQMPMHELRAKWLYSHALTQLLLGMAGGGGGGEQPEAQHPDPLLGGPALRLLSSILKLAPKYSVMYGLLGNHTEQQQQHQQPQHPILAGFQRALYNFDSSDEMGRLAFIDAVSSYASSSHQTLQIVLQDSILRNGWLCLSSVPTPKLKRVILNSVSQVMYPSSSTATTTTNTTEEGGGGESSLSSTTTMTPAGAMALYDTLGMVNNSPDTTDLLLQLTRSPLIEVRLGAYDVMSAVAFADKHAGARKLLRHAEFYPFLLNNNDEGGMYEERTKVGKEGKFQILVGILESGVKNLLAEDVVKRLEERRRRGPHFVKTVGWEMATE